MAPPVAAAKAGKVMRWRVNGVGYVLDRGQMTGKLERELWRQAELTLSAAVEALQQGAMFGVAAMMWLARRQAGHDVRYEQVEEELYRWAADDDLAVEFVQEGDGDDAGPPADGGS